MKTADICDRYPEEVSICEIEFKSFGKRHQFSGPMQTVRLFEDNVLVKEAIQQAPAGSVLVVDGGGSKNCALMGDQLAELALERGLAGVIIYGCVRDASALSSMDLGVFAIGTHPKKSNKEGKGRRDIGLFFGGIEWHPGDFVYCDEDGVLTTKKDIEVG
ncbi:ribonuclease E activity regulator RraA [Bacillus testis]|uniref:ribonuclease E activity regulator RraA n=1 Tax=Bacillus testis TaxID=1622072 RepID=UPI00067E8488|nr:ribonuclease E activity regulator RraA [Bacillus testis]